METPRVSPLSPTDDLDDEALAMATLRAVCRDPEATAQAKAQAARTLLELSGLLGKHSKAPEDHLVAAEMTREQMKARLLELEKARKG